MICFLGVVVQQKSKNIFISLKAESRLVEILKLNFDQLVT